MDADADLTGKSAASSESDSTFSWKQTEELFHRAMDCPAHERVGRVIEWCGRDIELRQGVLELLEADISVQQLISTAPSLEPGDFLERDKGDGAGDDKESDEDQWVGRVLGAFRLERLLGRGGMGVVYLGERISGGFTQTVAVKLVGWHLRSSPAVAQFLLERETLARLEHANIARLLDGGVTDEGFPYVVMEYVEGRRLDTACDDPSTSIDQIIRWMLQLCEAVTYVHRNLILHRDLKPGNVMVTENGVVKLLDFGTLKRIGTGDETDSALESEMTRAGMRPVTVRYASPEHIQGTRISTAADVYSLGMILYRLIAGKLPDELDNLPIGLYVERLTEGGFKPPSQVAQMHSRTRAIKAHVANDLDAIISKAIRYEAGARYPTVDALAEDLWSVLLHRPVTARSGSLQYRAIKFYRRNRWSVRSAVAALVVLVIGLSAMAWQGHVAHLQELRAEKGVEDERQLAHLLLFDYFEQLSLIPGSIDAQRKAVTQALGYLDRLSQIAPGSSLEMDTIRGFTDIGNLLGNPYQQNLGNVPEAFVSLSKAVSMANARVEKHPRDLDSQVTLIKAETALGGTYLGNGDAVRAEPILRSAAETASEMAANPRVTAPMLESASSVTDLLGDAYDPGRGYATADINKSMEYYRLSDKYDEMCDRADPKAALCSAGIVVGEYKFGSLIEDTDPASAAAHYRHGLEVVMQYPPELQKTTRSLRGKNYMLARLGLMEMRTGNMSEGIALADKAQAGFREAIAKAELDNRARFDLVAFETDLAVEYDRSGKEQEAAKTANEVLEILSVLLKRSPDNIRWQMIQAQDLMTYGRTETKLGHRSEGAQAIRKGLEEVVRLAENKDASPETLGLAADSLLEFHLHPTDARLALGFAQRAVDAFAKPTPTQLLTLAKAQFAVGASLPAAKTAQSVIAGLSGPVKSKLVADQIAEARRLANE
jgi:eukaryotic-like serine/threonine-protein kinase